MGNQNLTGHILGQYELRELLGTGGMGAVYRAHQINLDRAVALKVLAPHLAAEPGYIERFYREARTAAALEHTHIVPIHDYGVQGDLSYVAMRLLTGGTLNDRLLQRASTKQALPSLSETANLLKQLASALDYAHHQGVIHRDVKPSNVMFDNQGNAFLVDFGIAKILESTHSMTGTGTALGTPSYMPPEQWRSVELTPAADQYALGVLLYALITGRVPFEASTPYGLMHKHLNDPPTPPQSYRADIPDEATLVLERALAKSPADRFPSVTAFAQAFERAIGGAGGEATNFFVTPLRNRPALPALPSTPSSSLAARSAATPVPVSLSRRLLTWGAMVLGGALLAVLAMLLLNPDQEKISTPEAEIAQTQVALGATQTAVVEALASGEILDEPEVTVTLNPTLITHTPAALLPTSTRPVVEVITSPTLTWTATPSSTRTLTVTSSRTPTPTATNSLTPTLDIAFIVQTLDAEATEQQATYSFQATAAARATGYAISTQDVLDETATATLWTQTPTPNVTASIEAYRTQQAATVTQAWIDTWTDTPTSTATATATATATHTPTPTTTPNPVQLAQTPVAPNSDWTPVVQEFDGVEMMLVPAGCFMMGSEAGKSDEQPVHEVCFEEPFWVGKTEVTNAQYKQCVQAGPCTLPGDIRNYFDSQYADHPVVYVDWNQASAYAAWWGEATNTDVRLPTEAQWEYAARGPDGLTYPWGNDVSTCALANTTGCVGNTSPVGSYPNGMSWVGVQDMSGNVWEWVADWYGAYPVSRQVDPVGPVSGTLRVLRGGSWGLDQYFARAAVRLNRYPDFGDNLIGFRVVRVAENRAAIAEPTVETTPDPAQVAQTPVTRNANWTPVVQDFGGVEMMLVPAGCFMMGSEAGKSDEQPVHEVCFEEPFWIGKTEVTNAQYKQCVQAGPCTLPGDIQSYFDSQYADHPVTFVNWGQANDYVAWLGQTFGAEVVLPTEAQWEYAARGPDGLTYPWGNDVPTCTLANTTGCVGNTSPVGSYPNGMSWVGVQDMSGNVLEWVADWYGAYPVSRQMDPVGHVSGTRRVLRGGSWNLDQNYARAAYRGDYFPVDRSSYVGFRVMCPLSP